ncbi:hypothetical protein [Pseudomonas sp.]|uniref:hypothetical protein n=1 Tax=Pseudomonas sp. TaxID=306 RepID=UPI003FD73EEC
MTDELNHHNDPTGLVQSANQANNGLPYLGETDVVDRLLREMTAGVLDRFDRVGHGLLTPGDAADADGAECQRLGTAFAGGDPAFAIVPGWNTGGLAQRVRSKMSESVQAGEPDAAVLAQAFAVFVHHIYDQLNITGNGGTEAELQDGLNENIRSFTWLLVGLDSNE